jgi:peptide deformylase
MQLVKPDDPILHRVCRPSFVLDADVIQQMFWLLEQLGGLGLAAPQVGIDARLFLTAWREVFVNPGILRVEGEFVSSQEGCLSLPGIVRFKSRCQRIILAGGDIYEGQQAVVIQHEIDHLNGILITDEQ